MAKSTGPLLVAGGLTWANQTIMSKTPADTFETTARVGVATGVLAGMFYGVEKASPELATGLAWTLLVTSLFVRFNNKPTPLERILSFF